jgi:hypothetical protein
MDQMRGEWQHPQEVVLDHLLNGLATCHQFGESSAAGPRVGLAFYAREKFIVVIALDSTDQSERYDQGMLDRLLSPFAIDICSPRF